MRKHAILVTIALLVVAVGAQAQVNVASTTVEKKEYSSPVVLDVNFNLANQTLWGAGRVSPKQSLDSFVCEGIYVDDFGMEGKGKGKDNKEELEATIYFTLNAENGTPKRKASVSVQLFNGETAVTQPVKTSVIKLKDNDREEMKLKLKVDASKLVTDPITMLKLTLTVDK